MRVLVLELHDTKDDDLQLMGLFQSEESMDAYVRSSWHDPRPFYGESDGLSNIHLYELYNPDGVYSTFDLIVSTREVR